MRFAYADPPYIGQARRHYKDRADYDGEVDHQALLGQLHDKYPDGWALSASTSSLWTLIPMIPLVWKCRIAAWVKPFASFKPNRRPGYCWEPVIFRGGRQLDRFQNTPRDFLIANILIRTGLPGAKPDEFCFWIFELLNMHPDDEFVDLFPGTGRVMRAWEVWRERMPLFAGGER